MVGTRGRGKGRGRGRGGTSSGGNRGRGRPKKMVIESDEEEVDEVMECDIIDNIIDLPNAPLLNSEPQILEGGGSKDEEMSSVTASSAKRTKYSKGVESIAPQTTSSTSSNTQSAAKKMESESEKRMKRLTEIEAALDEEIDSIVQGKIKTPFMASFLTHLKQPAIMKQYSWNYKRCPKEKRPEHVPNPNVHICDFCKLPILIYGRLIQCRHVYCLKCAQSEIEEKRKCPKCDEKVYRVEEVKFGNVFMCNYGGTKYGDEEGCGRTYLSSRDLQAHIDHRHKPKKAPSPLLKDSESKIPISSPFKHLVTHNSPKPIVMTSGTSGSTSSLKNTNSSSSSINYSISAQQQQQQRQAYNQEQFRKKTFERESAMDSRWKRK